MASRTPVGRLIDRFIASTHPRAPLAGQGDMIVRVGQRYGVDPRLLAAIARKESQFGIKSGMYKFNPGGWGVKLGPSVYTSRSWEEGFSKIAKGLAGSLYKGAGLTTPAQIFMRYSPPSENNTAQYVSQVNTWMRQMGANPNQSVFGPQTTASNAAANTNAATSPGGSTSEQYAEVTRMVPGQIDKNRLMMLLGNQRQRSLRGLMPAPGFRSELSKLAQSALPRAETTYAVRRVGRQTQQAVAPVGRFPAAPQGTGGGWAGSEPRANLVARVSGLPVTSRKRSTRNTASGNVSDHWTGSTQSYAVDLGATGATGDRAYRKVMQYLAQISGNPSIANLPAGKWHNLNIGGYRYQVGWRTEGHHDHVHVGVKKL